jgi:hypothetical protein
VQSLVALRRGAPMVVALARTTSIGQDYWYAYVIDDMVLVKEVTPAGLHRFGLARDDRLLELVVASAVHPDAADAAGRPVAMPDDPLPDPLPDPPPPLLQTLGQALLRADLVVRHAGAGAAQVASLYTGPAGSWLVAHREAEPSVAFPMRAQELREHVRTSVREARRVLEGHRG